jgi:trans-aconitate methyltransferase
MAASDLLPVEVNSRISCAGRRSRRAASNSRASESFGQVDATLGRARFTLCIRCALGNRRRVLDLGCGAGYGTAELGAPRSATGIDLAQEAIDHASSAYPLANISFVPASVTEVLSATAPSISSPRLK